MSSYFVMPGSIDKVLAAFARGLAAGPTRPIDLFVREEAQAGRLRLGCIFPFITTPYHVDGALPTTIPDREANTAISRAVLSLLSYSFFIDRDKRVEPGIPSFDLSQMSLEQLDCGDLSVANTRSHLPCG